MASFTATQPFSGNAYITTGIYSISNSGTYTAAVPWYARAFTNDMSVRVFRGAQVKTWNGSAWVLVPAGP